MALNPNMNMHVTVDMEQFKKICALLNMMLKESDVTEETLTELINLLPSVNESMMETLLRPICVIVTKCSATCCNNTGSDQRKKCLLVDIVKRICNLTQMTSVTLYFQFYIFLAQEIFDPNRPDCVANISEEYKLSIMNAVVALSESLTYEAKQTLYTHENALYFSKMLLLAINLANNEKLQSLRLASIECVMSLAQITHAPSDEDRQFRKEVADIFIHYAPGIISGLSSIMKDDNRCGHRVILMAFRALGRFVTLQMENYNNISVGSANFAQVSTSVTPSLSSVQDRESLIANFKSKRIDAGWYRSTDEKFRQIFDAIEKVTWHSHQQVRLEVAINLLLIIERCADTMPKFSTKALEVLIKLSEDEDAYIANLCTTGLQRFQKNFPAAKLKDLLESLEEAFFVSLTAIPRIFNSFDDAQQLSSLNLLVGYARLFGSRMHEVLQSMGHSHRLIETLIHISEFERKDIRLFEEYAIEELEPREYLKTPWRNFRYINSEAVREKFESFCRILAQFDADEQISYLLIDIFTSSKKNRREVTYILNNMLSGMPDRWDHLTLLNTVVKLYMERQYWVLPIEVSYKCQLFQVQYNVIQICLQLEGIGKIATRMGMNFKYHLLLTLSPILQKAGSTNPLIRLAGTNALSEVAKACDYPTIALLIQDNYDYFSFHISKQIRRFDETVAISILTTVLRYSDVSNMPSITAVITDVLSQTYYKYFQEDLANAYLNLFKIFIKTILRWLSIEPVILPIKSKQEMADEYVEFQVSDLDSIDEANGKTAEGMYRENLERYNTEEDFKDDEPELTEIEDNEKRPEYITLMVKLLNRVLNFLPSKDKTRKLLVLDILIDGLEVLRDWENDLLPLVHKIWGPLVDRFKEIDECLIINRSYQLLVTLARLSKDFIRSRTIRDVLPHVLHVLKSFADYSYLKDHGAAYRYTQAYKLQLTILQQLSKVVIDIDMDDSHIVNVLRIVIYYLSAKQPIPLQEASLSCFSDLMIYDRVLVTKMMRNLLAEGSDEYLKEYRKNIDYILKDGTTVCNI